MDDAADSSSGPWPASAVGMVGLYAVIGALEEATELLGTAGGPVGTSSPGTPIVVNASIFLDGLGPLSRQMGSREAWDGFAQLFVPHIWPQDCVRD